MVRSVPLSLLAVPVREVKESNPLKNKGSTEADSVRVDRWLWSVRVFKTRGLAAKACRESRVRMGGVAVKASKLLRVSDQLEVKKGKQIIRVTVSALLEKRIGPKEASKFKEEYILESEPTLRAAVIKSSGQGRPTKKQRRVMESFLNEVERNAQL
jgi:ribosome-associated heat shock protein Hsp15